MNLEQMIINMYDVVCNARETDKAGEFFSETFVEVTPGYEGKGPESFLRRNQDFYEQEKAAIELVKVFGEKETDHVAVYAKARLGSVTLFRIAAFFEIKNGLIVSHRSLHQKT